ncbi:MAG: YkvA family protein [Bulleidia sp.]|nr:YkvA family protein [Bulleidia sp.]
MDWKKRAQQLQDDIPAVFLAMKDKETPLSAKILAGLAIAYALSPIDLIPDFIPGIGYLDDLIILPVLIAAAIKRVPSSVMERCRNEAKHMRQGTMKARWYYALPILLVYALIIWIIVKAARH